MTNLLHLSYSTNFILIKAGNASKGFASCKYAEKYDVPAFVCGEGTNFDLFCQNACLKVHIKVYSMVVKK